MHCKSDNPNTVLPIGVNMIIDRGVKQESRNGPTLEIPEPVITTYRKPLERVLLDDVRDCNPFFHYMESIWMLAGRQDTEFLTKFVPGMSDFSDDGLIFNSAYGYRIRHHFGFDQFAAVIDMLKKDTDTRRAVIQIWDHQDLHKESKDYACNTSMMFKIRNGKLNLTVTNRSNDMIWGAYGANVVHFSMMQEYVAAAVGVPVGVYNQVSDSLHVYTNNPKWKLLSDKYYHDPISGSLPVSYNPYEDRPTEVFPHQLVEHPSTFLQECERFCDDPLGSYNFYNRTFSSVAQPMYLAYTMHKEGNVYGALNVVHSSMMPCDWKVACTEWLKRRTPISKSKFPNKW